MNLENHHTWHKTISLLPRVCPITSDLLFFKKCWKVVDYESGTDIPRSKMYISDAGYKWITNQQDYRNEKVY